MPDPNPNSHPSPMRRRILFVDDEPRVLSGLRRLLHPMRAQWDMSFAEGGQQALAMLDQQPYDVVITDMRMPGMDGATLLAEVRQRLPRAVRIILSGQSDKELVLRSVGPAHQYLAKPCEPEILRQTIERACALRDLLDSDAVQRVVGAIESLPSLPEQYVRLQTELRSAAPSIARIGRIIEEDLGMTAKILQLVNSAFFGLRRHVSEPAEAAKLLGTETISSLALSMNVFRQFSKAETAGLDLESLTSHSLRVATLVRAICRAEKAGASVADDAFLAGMLHDAGKLIMAQSWPQQYRQVLHDGSGECPVAIETRLFGVSHAEVGAYLYGLWGLPNSIVEAVAFHHAPARLPVACFSPLVALHVANALDQPDTGPARDTRMLDHDYLDRAGLSERLQVWLGLVQQGVGA